MAAANINKLPIPKEIENDVKCKLCSNFLSVPNVVVFNISDEPGIYLCGRCTDQLPERGIRATAYEAVAKLLIFPCRYVKLGCNKQLAWGGVLDHEMACDHRLHSCPLDQFEMCKWQGTIKTMVQHVAELHKTAYMPLHYFILPMKDGEQFHKILSAFDEVFLVQYMHDSNKCFISVKLIGKPSNTGKFNYEVGMKSGSDDNMYQICNKAMKHAANYNMDKKTMTEIDVNSLKIILKSTKISCHIKIIEKNPTKLEAKKPEVKKLNLEKPKPEKKKVDQPKTPKIPKHKVASNSEVDLNLLTELECPVCSEYMIPPIFICQTGHSICISCHEKMGNCPTCRGPFSGARNFTLEKLTSIVKYPCQNSIYGCQFVGLSTMIRKHEIICKMAHVKCPLEMTEKCNWTGTIGAIYPHATQQHAAFTWIKMNEPLFRNLKSTTYIDINIVLFDNEIFTFCNKHSKSLSGPVHWCVQHMNLKTNEKPRYKIEIEFIDQSKTGRKLVINDLCYPVSEYKDIFTRGLQIPYSLLIPFINRDSYVIFKYNMVRV